MVKLNKYVSILMKLIMMFMFIAIVYIWLKPNLITLYVDYIALLFIFLAGVHYYVFESGENEGSVFWRVIKILVYVIWVFIMLVILSVEYYDFADMSDWIPAFDIKSIVEMLAETSLLLHFFVIVRKSFEGKTRVMQSIGLKQTPDLTAEPQNPEPERPELKENHLPDTIKNVFRFLLILITFAFLGLKYINYFMFFNKTDTVETESGIEKKYYYDSGELLLAENYVDGTLNGASNTYYKSGLLKKKVVYLNGKIEGKVMEYFENGSVKYEMKYQNGKKHGFETWFDKEGFVERKDEYVKGNIKAIRLYYPDGQLKYDCPYSEKKANGIVREYHENGKLKEVREVKNNMRFGIAKYYEDDGFLVRQTIFEADEVVSEKIFNRIEPKKVEGKKDIENKVFVYYPSGKIFEVWPKKNGYNDGKYTQYFESGVIKQECIFKKGKKNGKRVLYYESGAVESVCEMKNDLEDGPYTSYWENGNKKETGTFHQGYIDSVRNYYRQCDGEIWKINTYEKGELIKEVKLRPEMAGSVVAPVAAPSFFSNVSYRIKKFINQFAADILIMFEKKRIAKSAKSGLNSEKKRQRFYPSGKLETEWSVKNDMLDGVCNAYWEHGGMREIGYFRDGLQHGVWEYFREADGKLFKKTTFNMGNMVTEKFYLREEPVAGEKNRLFLINYFKNGEFERAEEYD